MIRPVAALAATAIAVSSCGASGSSSCTELREPVDPASFLHVLDPGAAVFLTDPPTSGPHVSGLLPTGALDTEIDPAIQVSILESGSALVQYRPDLPDDQVRLIVALTGPSVVVAPSADLPATVVATAWTWKLSCSSPDLPALTKFVGRRRSAAPGSD